MNHDDEQAFQRQMAIGTFNASWDLLDQDTRTADEDAAMLEFAMGSRYLWSNVGGPREWAIGDNQIARIAAAIGEGTLAVRYAKRSLARVLDQGFEDFTVPSAYEVLARAHGAVGDWEKSSEALADARRTVALLDDEEDREIIGAQIDTVPTAP